MWQIFRLQPVCCLESSSTLLHPLARPPGMDVCWSPLWMECAFTLEQKELSLCVLPESNSSKVHKGTWTVNQVNCSSSGAAAACSSSPSHLVSADCLHQFKNYISQNALFPADRGKQSSSGCQWCLTSISRLIEVVSVLLMLSNGCWGHVFVGEKTKQEV